MMGWNEPHITKCRVALQQDFTIVFPEATTEWNKQLLHWAHIYMPATKGRSSFLRSVRYVDNNK
jgi:hypothetical protein